MHAPLPNGRVRCKGGGPKPLSERDPTLVSDLQRHAEPATMGDPMRPLKWVSKSPAKLAEALEADGHAVSSNTVAKLLSEKLEYSRQVNRKTHEGASHPDRVVPKARFQRDAQLEHINSKVVAAQAAGQPVDLGRHEEEGTRRVHDFEDKALGKVVPYGV